MKMQFTISFKHFFKKFRYTVTQSVNDDSSEYFILYANNQKLVIESKRLLQNNGNKTEYPDLELIEGELKNTTIRNKMFQSIRDSFGHL